VTSQVARALRQKRRLTRRLRRRDLRRYARGRHLRYRRSTLLRAGIFKADAVLESAGLLAAPAPASSLWENGWLVGATRMPGRNAGYRAGRCLMRGGVVHYTVGRDSRGPGLSGLFAFLLPKDAPAIQFAEIDAVCFHACEWNHDLFGVETEKLGDWEPTTDSQITEWGRIARGAREYGVDASGYDNSIHTLDPNRGLPEGTNYAAHRALRQYACDPHQDYLPDEEMARVFALAGATPAPKRRRRRKDTDVTMEIFSANTDGGRPWPVTGQHRLVVTQPTPEGPKRSSTLIDLAQTLEMVANGSAAHFGGDRGQVNEILEPLGLPKFPPQ
jgi:hypothetical protein